MLERIALDDVFDALRHPHRRALLGFLSSREDPASVSAMVDALSRTYLDDGSTVPTESTGSVDSPSEPSEVHLAIVHVHLPKLAFAGLLEWDGDRATLTPMARDLTVPSPVTDGQFEFETTGRRSPP